MMNCLGIECSFYSAGLCTASNVIVVPGYRCPRPNGFPSNDPPELPTTTLDEKPYDVILKPDMVNQPPHYTQGGVECIDAIKAAVTGRDPYQAWLTGQVIKYIWRYPYKNGLQDLEKAEFYLKRLIEEVKE